MGNNNSQSAQTPSHQERQWTNSYPREPSRLKVLPERIPGQRLRVTDNGAILQNGGTISGRRQTLPANLHYSDDDQTGVRVLRSRSTSTHHPHHHQPQQFPSRDGLAMQAKRFGSEPDLRFPREHGHDSPSKQRIVQRQVTGFLWSRKKYKAPPPPPGGESHGPDSSSPDSFHWEMDPPRRMRLFKTRAETKKHQMEHKSPVMTSRFTHFPASSPRPLQRSLSSPEFQEELLKAAQRLRPPVVEAPPSSPYRSVREREAPVGQAALAPRGDGSGRESTPEPPPPSAPTPPIEPAPQLPPRRKPAPPQQKSPEKHWEIIPPPVTRNSERRDRDVPAKTFYFGMEQGEREAVEKFAASLHRPANAANPTTPTTATTTTSSSLSSEEEGDEFGGTRGGIAMQLRPTLPKKQLEIPRFSPTAAWRLLSALDAHAPASSTTTVEESPVLLEERIQRLARPVAPPPLPAAAQAPRSSHDKSGDSGISGDASPGGCPEESEAPAVRKNVPQHAWTPQQDLEEESSSDGGVDALHAVQQPVSTIGLQPKFSPRSHVFSLSLPRDDRLCLALYNDNDNFISPMTRIRRETPPSFNSLKKLKRSVLGTGIGGRREDERGDALDGNWVLSRSVPNLPQHPASSSTTSPSSPDFSYLANGGHVMYLPQYSTIDPELDRTTPRGRSYSAGVGLRNLRSSSHLSKSCENISVSEMRQIGRTPSPEIIDMMGIRNRDSVSPNIITEEKEDSNTQKRSKGRRFTFQSTVRQIERRRLAEKLSKEAELKERQRLTELEAMRQVEEEFQRKRAREKANIRQQLRLFSLDENLYSSLPTGWGDGTRAEPDGAPSSSPASHSSAHSGGKVPANRQGSGGSNELKTQTTQVLSEFREPRRDYRDYRPARHNELGPEPVPHMESKRAMVHPPVVYDMPKSMQVYITSHHPSNGGTGSGFTEQDRSVSTPRSSSSDNYRRTFAHGAITPGRSNASSDSELSQGNLRPGHLRHQRSRSVSPVREPSSPSSNLPDDSVPGEQQEITSLVSEEEVKINGGFLPQEHSSPTGDGHSRFGFTSLQPFVRNNKGYRPIVFNPGNSSSHKVAQPVS
ncbi:uncharacterized protein [Anabrus simplex]|uniref:uncharacterized protein n=1 Tax=Anabrus simplex TaxID=316456 RepID=UPI0035A2AC16